MLIDISTLIFIHVVCQLSRLIFGENDTDDVFETNNDLITVQSAIFVRIELLVEPLRVLAQFRQLGRYFEYEESELQMLSSWCALKNVVRLQCRQNALLQLFIVFEGKL